MLLDLDLPQTSLYHKRPIGMCRWMGSHFHNLINHNGIAFSIQLLEWGLTFPDFGGKKVLHLYG